MPQITQYQRDYVRRNAVTHTQKAMIEHLKVTYTTLHEIAKDAGVELNKGNAKPWATRTEADDWERRSIQKTGEQLFDVHEMLWV